MSAEGIEGRQSGALERIGAQLGKSGQAVADVAARLSEGRGDDPGEARAQRAQEPTGAEQGEPELELMHLAALLRRRLHDLE